MAHYTLQKLRYTEWWFPKTEEGGGQGGGEYSGGSGMTSCDETVNPVLSSCLYDVA